MVSPIAPGPRNGDDPTRDALWRPESWRRFRQCAAGSSGRPEPPPPRRSGPHPERVASRRKGGISTTCSGKSWRRSQFTLTKAPLRAESASTSCTIPFWFRRETAPEHLGSRRTQGPEAPGVLKYQANRFSCSSGARKSARHGAYASRSGCREASALKFSAIASPLLFSRLLTADG